MAAPFNPAGSVLELQDVPGPVDTSTEAAGQAAALNQVTPGMNVIAVSNSSDEHQQQQEVTCLSPISMPTNMLLPLQQASLESSPQRIQYTSQTGAYDSELSEDASSLLDAPAACVSRQPSSTEGILEDTWGAAAAAAAIAAADAVANAADGLTAGAGAAAATDTALPASTVAVALLAANAADSTCNRPQTLSKSTSSANRGRSRVSRESSQHDISQMSSQQQPELQQKQRPPAVCLQEETAGANPSPTCSTMAGSEPPSLADWRTPSSANSSIRAGIMMPIQAQQVQSVQQQSQPQEPAGASVTAYTTTTVAAVPAAAAHSTSLDADSAFREALAKLTPVRTSVGRPAAAVGPATATATAPAAGNAADGRRSKAGATASADSATASNHSKAAADGTAAAVVASGASAAGDDTVMTPMYHKHSSSNLLSLTIRRSTPLKPDLLVTNPVVRLHVVNAATGEYVRMEHHTAHLQEQQQQQQGVAAAGVSSSSGIKTGRLMRHMVEPPLQDKMLESLGRPALSTVDNDTACPRPALLEYIPPIQTRPFDMLEGSAISSSSCAGATATGLVAEWEEELCVDLSVEHLRECDALLLLEVLQLPSGFARFQHHVQSFDLAGHSHPVAWAFLRLQGLQAPQQQLAAGKPLQLQLYQYKPAALGAVHALSKGFSGPHPATAAKAAYLSWVLSGFTGVSADSPGSPRSPLRAALGGIWGTQQPRSPRNDASPAAAAAAAAGGVFQQQLQQRPASPASGSVRQASDADKYPGFLQVVLAAKPRPVPEMMVVITDPASNIRPDVPAGYGTGFEHGRIPFCLLHKPRALGAAGGRSFRNSQNGAAEAGSLLMDKQLMLLESRLHRPHTQLCQVPNAVLVDIKGSAGGCSCIATSRDGRWLAAACADAAGRFKINLYQALTGRFLWMLGLHEGLVYSINWAKDDSAIITTSADFTAKVWHLPILPTPGNANQGSGILNLNATFSDMGVNTVDGTGLGTAAAAEAAAEAGVACTVLQHRCFVYAGELHPVRQPWLLAVTGAYDGTIRVWGTEEGTVLYSLQVSSCPINCLAFNQLGSRMYTGDAAGTVQELSVDVSPLSESATAAAAFGAALAGAAAADGCDSPAGDAVSPRVGVVGNPKTPRGQQVSKGLAAAEAVSPVAAVLRYGSTASQIAAGRDVLKVLRTSHELSGSPIVTIACHPGGHQLVVLTKCRGTASKSKGVSDLVVIDVKLLLVARRLGGVKCCSAPLKFGISPDGEHIICGSEDGSATIWHFETGTATLLPHMALGGAPVYCMAWNNCFQSVATCSFSPYAPIRVLCFTPDEPCVKLNPPNTGAAAVRKQKSLKASLDAMGDAAALRRHMLPEHLTPHHVHLLLEDIRASAAQRGIYKQPTDPDGQYLVVKTPGTNHHRPVHRQQRSGKFLPAEQQQTAGALQAMTDSSGSSSLQGPNAQRTAKAAGRLSLLVGGSEAGDGGCAGLDAAAGADGTANKAFGGKNRENRRSRVSAGCGDAGGGGAGGAASQPCTPKVVLNRRGGAAGGVAAPWLQQQ